MALTFGSLFAGIGGLDLGLERAGMTCAWQVEVDKACRFVLSRHWPDVPKHGDITQLKGADLGAVDAIVGGFPCQDVSLAGRRAGLAGKRSGLFFEFARLIDELAPRWVVIENVPGLLSSNGGRDMGAVLGTLAELGYGYAYRILDAQYFGVPQRRRRVVIVGNSGDWSAPAAVLFEPESVRGDSPPRRETGPRVAANPETGPLGGGNYGTGRRDEDDPNLVVSTLQGGGKRGYRVDAESAGGGATHPGRREVVAALTADGVGTCGADDNQAQAGHLVALFNPYRISTGPGEWVEGFKPDEIHDALTAQPPPKGPPLVTTNLAVRRLTPKECERLQGFPDDWTAEQSDAARYRQLGNAVAVPVAEWLGRRIVAYVEQNAEVAA